MNPRFALPALLLGLALLPAGHAAPASDRPSDYRASAPIQVPAAAKGEGLLRLPLPFAVLQQSLYADRRDLRVFNARGEAVPIAWSGAPEPAAPRRTALPLFAWPEPPAGASQPGEVSIRLGADGSLRLDRAGAPPTDPKMPDAAGHAHWLLDLRSLGNSLPARLRLQWAEREPGWVRQLRVEASADARTWQAAGEATLLDLGAPESTAAATPPLRQDEVTLQPLPPGARYLRLVLDQPLALTHAEAESQAAAAPALERLRLRGTPAGEGRWEFDLGTPLAPREMQLHLPQPNSVAPFEIAQHRPAPPGSGREAWSVVAHHTAYRLLRAGRELEAPPFPVQAPPARRWRLRLADPGIGDGAPELTLGWLPPELLFAARGPGPFTLAVGREQSVARALDRAELIPAYRRGDEFRLPAARLGEVQATPTVTPTPLDRWREAGPEERRRWLLWGVLVAAVGGLGVLAWRLWREMAAAAPGRCD